MRTLGISTNCRTWLLLMVAICGGCATRPMENYLGVEIAPYIGDQADQLTGRFGPALSESELQKEVCAQQKRGFSPGVIARSAISQNTRVQELAVALRKCSYPPFEVAASILLASNDPADDVHKSLLAAGIPPRAVFRAEAVTGRVITDDPSETRNFGQAAASGTASIGPLIRWPFPSGVGWPIGWYSLGTFVNWSLGTVSETYRVQRVLFATNRRMENSARPHEMYGLKRAEVTFGRCDVSVPRNHETGQLETKPWYWPLQWKSDPSSHFVIVNGEPVSRERFVGEIRDRVRGSRYRDVLLFVHGFNETFENAALRTAQLAIDLDFQGPAVFFSWPSQGSLHLYSIDRQAAEWSHRDLAGVLRTILSDSEERNVFVIAHSMGGYVLSGALRILISENPPLAARIAEVILAAPDIDADVFRRDVVPALVRMGKPVTLYASSEDAALQASKRFNGAPRAGDSGSGLIVEKGIETIDSTGIDTSLLKHSYASSVPRVLSDMFYLIRERLRADRRYGLREVNSSIGRYWEFAR